MTNDLLGSKHNYFELFKATSLALSPDLKESAVCGDSRFHVWKHRRIFVAVVSSINGVLNEPPTD